MMKHLFWLGLSLLWYCVAIVTANVPTPVSNVQVSLRGKKYQVEDVTTVQELQERLSEQSGVQPSDQGRVLFNGKRLDGSDSLSVAGVSSGDQLNIVPKTKKSSSTSSSSSSSTKSAASAGATTGSSAGAAAAATSASDPSAKMKELLEQSGVDTNALVEMYKNMGGGSGADGNPPSLQESMDMMSDMMNSPIFTEYMNDPERLEQSRQMILNNPMLKSMMAGMPGMEDLLNDPVAWREAMQAAASMYQNMDKNELMQAMMGGAGGAGGMPPGLFDGMDVGSENLALDELSEGED